MKFTCNQKVLTSALNTVSKAVSSRTTIPILKGILLDVKDGYLTLSASDLDLSIEKKIEVNVEEEGSCVVFAKLFSDIIRKLPDCDISIEETEKGIIVIKTTSSEFTITGLSADEFPNIKENEEDIEKLNFNKEIFNNMIGKTCFSASIDESKGIIVGVLVELENDSLNMVALDGFRMAVVREAMKNDLSKKIIIDAKILNEVSKIISETDDIEDVNILLSSKKAIFLLGNTKVVVRLLEGDFIKYKDILPKAHKTDVVVNRKDFEAAIERASLVAREGKNNLIKLSISDEKLLITSRSEEGNVKEEVFISKNGDDLTIGFNSKYLLDALKVIDDDEIKLEMNTSVTPCIVKPVEGNNYDYLILPVRI